MKTGPALRPDNFPLIDLANKLREPLSRRTETNTLLQVTSIAPSRKRPYDMRNIGVKLICLQLINVLNVA